MKGETFERASILNSRIVNLNTKLKFLERANKLTFEDKGSIMSFTHAEFGFNEAKDTLIASINNSIKQYEEEFDQL